MVLHKGIIKTEASPLIPELTDCRKGGYSEWRINHVIKKFTDW